MGRAVQAPTAMRQLMATVLLPFPAVSAPPLGRLTGWVASLQLLPLLSVGACSLPAALLTGSSWRVGCCSLLSSPLLGMFLDGLDFSGPPCLQIMGSSTLLTALSSKCSFRLGLQRLLQASNPGTWRNNSDLSLDLFWQPPLGFKPILSFPRSHGQCPWTG